jgi:hypothetical protein
MAGRLIFLPLVVVIILGTGSVRSDQPNEEMILVSYAQDLYRQKGLNISRSAFDLVEIENQQRLFYIDLISRNSTLSEDLLNAFLIGGAVSQQARIPMDLIVVHVNIEFSNKEDMILQASGECCEKLYANQMTVEIFSELCLIMQ